MLTISDISKEAKVSHDTVRAWIRSGDLPAIDVSRSRYERARYRIEPADWEAFKRKSRVPAKKIEKKQDYRVYV